MKLTKTQKAVLIHLAGGAHHGLFVNHAERAARFLRANGLAEGYEFQGVVCGQEKTCYGTRITEAGKTLAEEI